jgi:four helix bundle protein
MVRRVQRGRGMNQQAEALKARTRRFALDVIALARTLAATPEGDTIRRQLLRAATGVAANYRSTCRSRSHDEFVARMGVVLEEADEAELWLGIVKDAQLSASPRIAQLCDESQQLRAIFSQSARTAQSRSKRRRL